MKKIIKKVAVLGAGVMGAQIAAHLANSNVRVILFDLPAQSGDKSSTVHAAIKNLAQLKPAPLATKELGQQIEAANYDEDLERLKDCDLIIEAIAENLQWKKSLYDQIEPYLGQHTILASNTSGLSINELSQQLAKPLRKHFLGVHFFNPPGYMHLLEMIPADDTDDSVIETLEQFFVSTLGKGLNTEEAKTIELKELKGKTLVMVMLYTTCKASCPRLAADMRSIESKVPKQYKGDVDYILISIDPKTDTPKRLKKFAIENYMDDEQWTFLQGTENSVREFANVLAVKYKQITPLDFSHSNIISVFDPNGELVHQQEGLGVDNKETISKIIETVTK